MGKMNICVVEVVAWSCCVFAIMFGAQNCMCEFTSTSSSPSLVAADYQRPLINSLKIEKIRFSIKEVTRESYIRFMLNLLNALTIDAADRSGLIPILPQLPETNSRSYVHVEISNGLEHRVTLAIHITNVYVVGYQATHTPEGRPRTTTTYFFQEYRDARVRNAAFPNADADSIVSLSFNGDYTSLGSRSNAPLGFAELREHVNTLSRTSPEDKKSIAKMKKALLVVIQMVAEAVRFTNLRQLILDTITTGQPYTPDGLIQDYQNNWGKISKQVQSSSDDGNFPNQITFNYQSQNVVLTNVRQVLSIVGLLLFVCRNPPRQSHVMFSNPSIDHRLSSSVLLLPTSSPTDKCDRNVAPTVRISGIDNLCITRERRPFIHGVNFQECDDSNDEQLWTFKASDQSIRSGERCLVTDGRNGDPVLLYNCTDKTQKWEVWNDGSIILFDSSTLLSLTATPSRPNYRLIVQDLYNGSSQAWYASNITKPSVKSIVAYNGLCLIPSDKTVWLEKCKKGTSLDEKWAIFSDGTIRPQQNRRNCLKLVYLRELERIVLQPCDGEAEERWMFQSDGTIYHMKTEMVLQVGRRSDGDIVQVEVSGHSDHEPRQIWFQAD